MPTPDLCTEQEVTRRVHGFPARVRQDDLLGPLFATSIRDRDRHLATRVRGAESRWSGRQMNRAAQAQAQEGGA